MELDLAGEHSERAYSIPASLVTPRPIAWGTTLGLDNVVNAAPFSFCNVLGDEPPAVGFCPRDREDGTPKDPARNIRLNPQFVVNFVDESVAAAMNRTAAPLPYRQSAGLPASLEYDEWGTLQISNNPLIIRIVKRVHVQDDLFDATALRIPSETLNVIAAWPCPSGQCRAIPSKCAVPNKLPR